MKGKHLEWVQESKVKLMMILLNAKTLISQRIHLLAKSRSPQERNKVLELAREDKVLLMNQLQDKTVGK